MNPQRSAETSLLLMACSQRKAVGLSSGAAWDVYDGQLFRILKNLQRSQPWQCDVLQILIVSARYGILKPDQEIAKYDERLVPSAVGMVTDQWGHELRRAVSGGFFNAVHVNLGKLYLAALPSLADEFPDTPIVYATGGIGMRNSLTRRWVMERVGITTFDGTSGESAELQRSGTRSMRCGFWPKP